MKIATRRQPLTFPPSHLKTGRLPSKTTSSKAPLSLLERQGWCEFLPSFPPKLLITSCHVGRPCDMKPPLHCTTIIMTNQRTTGFLLLSCSIDYLPFHSMINCGTPQLNRILSPVVLFYFPGLWIRSYLVQPTYIWMLVSSTQ